MDRAKANKAFHGNLTSTKPPTPLRDRDVSFSSCQPHHHHHHHNHRSVLDDSNSELSIFDAHKYFNELANNETQKITICSSSNNRVSPMENERVIIPENANANARYSSASSSVDGYSGIRNYRARSFHAATPTASSEASWNSQQGLLSHPPGAISVSVRNPPNSSSNSNSNNNNTRRTSLSNSKPNWLLRRKCPCTGRKSVQVEEKKKTPEPKITNSMPSPSPSPPPPPPPPPITKIQNHVHDHIVTPNDWVDAAEQAPLPTIVAAKSQRFQPHPIVTTVRVPFTDGFTFPVLNPNAGSTVKLRVPNSGEEPPRESLEVFQPPDDAAASFPFPPAKARDDDDDGASDASSDLFEIESFSTATQSTCLAAYRRRSRDSFDEGTATPECYEPSEASIEWSVTTAEGYAYEESIAAASAATGGEQWKRKGSGNGLLVSCRCEKAVSVGPQPVQRGSTSAWKHVGGVSVNNNSNNSNNSNIGSRVVVGSVNKPPLAARSHSHNHRNNSPHVTASLAFTT